MDCAVTPTHEALRRGVVELIKAHVTNDGVEVILSRPHPEGGIMLFDTPFNRIRARKAVHGR